LAKQSVSLVERHLEKVILGVAGAVLVASIVLFLVSTPNTVKIRDEDATPETIHKYLVESAQTLYRKLTNVSAEPTKVETFAQEFEAARSPLAFAGVPDTIRSPVPMLPRVPDAVEDIPTVGEILLAEVLAPQKPIVTLGRSTLDLAPPVVLSDKRREAEATGQPAFGTDVNWVTVAAKFDQQEHIAICQKAGYKPSRRNPYVLGADLQRREKRADGSYSEWKGVATYMPEVMPPAPEIDLEPGPKGPIPTIDTQSDLREYFRLLRMAQVAMFRPLFPDTIYGDDWLYPEFPDLDVAMLDTELCVADDDEECEPRFYGVQSVVEVVEDAPKTPREVVEDTLKRAKKAKDTKNWEEALKLAKQVLSLPEVRPNETREAQLVIDWAGQEKLDAQRRPKSTPRSGGKDGEPVERPRSRYQIIWAHDASETASGGAVSGATYQYRMRMKMFNRFCAQPQELKNADDARKVWLAGEWSEPSDDVYIPPDTLFFLTGGNAFAKSDAKVTVFKWFEGVWTKHAFRVLLGEKMGGTAREVVRVVNGVSDKPKIDFDTGSRAVDIDYDYEYRPTKRRGGGFEIKPSLKTIALVYEDERGVLRQRVLAADKNSPEYKEFKTNKVFDPRKTRR
jgi:hypothetical protein